MKTKTDEIRDELRPEYDFSKLKVVARGVGRAKPGEITVTLEPDVARKFPTSKAVNRALRQIIKAGEPQASR